MLTDKNSHFYTLNGQLDIIRNNNAVFIVFQKCLARPLKLRSTLQNAERSTDSSLLAWLV